MRTELASPARAAAGCDRRWLARKLDSLGFGQRLPAAYWHRERRVDVLLDGRPAALLMQPTTPLFAKQ